MSKSKKISSASPSKSPSPSPIRNSPIHKQKKDLKLNNSNYEFESKK